MKNQEHGKVWLVTGASSGFGRAIAEEALGRGARVVATARSASALDDLVALAPARVAAVALDVTREGDARRAIAAAVTRFGRIDVVVNNAGYGVVGAVEETSDAELRAVMETMFFGVRAMPALDAYATSVGPTRDFVTRWDGRQPGDPAKAARAIADAVAAESAPLRLPLGGDAVEAIRRGLGAILADLDRCEAVARATAFDAADS